MWLHMGAPARAAPGLLTAASPRLLPYKLVDNGESLLDKTDLVFIDAMGTGYSHAVCKATEKDFYGESTKTSKPSHNSSSPISAATIAGTPPNS